MRRWIFWATILGWCAGLHAQMAGGLDAGFAPPAVDGAIESVAVQADGRVLIAGSFRHVGGVAHAGVARLLANGQVDAGFAAQLSWLDDGGAFVVLAQTDGRILVGGYFSQVNGTNRNTLARLLADGSLDGTFDADFPAESVVFGLAPAGNGGVFASGTFARVGNLERVNVVKLGATGAVDTRFAPPPGVFALASNDLMVAFAVSAEPDGGVLVGGLFHVPALAGTPFNLVRLRADGSVDPQVNLRYALGTAVVTMAREADGSVLMGGALSYGKPSGRELVRLRPDGTIDESFAPVFKGPLGAGQEVDVVVVEPDGRVLVGGDFETVNGVALPKLARLLRDGTVDPRFVAQAAMDGMAGALALGQGTIVVGGDFTQVQGGARGGVARLSNAVLPPRIVVGLPATATVGAKGNVKLKVETEPVGGLAFQWLRNGVALTGETGPALHLVNVQEVADYTVEVTSAGGTVTNGPATLIVADVGAGAVDTSFVPATPLSAASPIGQSYTLVIPMPDGRVLAGNEMGLGLLEDDGSAPGGFGVVAYRAPGGGERSVLGGAALPDGRVLLRTRDRYVSGNPTGLERCLTDGRRDPSFQLSGFDEANVDAFAVAPDGRIILGGRFVVQGQATFMARVSVDGARDASFAAVPYVNGMTAKEIAIVGDRVFVRGNFFSWGGVARSGGAQLSLDGALDEAWVPAGQPLGFSSVEGSAYLGSAGGLNRLRPDGTIDPSFHCKLERVEVRGSRVLVSAAAPSGVFAQRDGRLVIFGDFQRVNDEDVRPPVRLEADGRIDRGFAVPLLQFAGGSDSGLMGIAAESGAYLYVAGQGAPAAGFTGIGGVARPALARLQHDGLGATRLVNLSARALAGVGERTLIAGFVTSGGTDGALLVRAAGPALRALGVSDAVAATRLELFRGGQSMAVNAGWAGDAAVAEAAGRLGAFPFANDSADAALWRIVESAPLTAQISAPTGEGVALAEVYDGAAGEGAARLTNLSARAVVESGQRVSIAGFVVRGEGAKQVLVRAVGPGLRTFGVQDALANPRLRLMHGAVAVAINDDWSDDGGAGFAAAAAQQAGAFALEAGSKDAALLRTLLPGSYTAVVEPADGVGGVGLVEIYEVTQ